MTKKEKAGSCDEPVFSAKGGRSKNIPLDKVSR
jgi:hypothetical protein